MFTGHDFYTQTCIYSYNTRVFHLLHLSTAILTLKLTELFVYSTDTVLGKLTETSFSRPHSFIGSVVPSSGENCYCSLSVSLLHCQALRDGQLLDARG